MMCPDEEKFEKFICDLPFDDRPDPSHRDRLEAQLRDTLARHSRPFRVTTGRYIMQSRITKLAAAAAVLIIVLGLGVFIAGPDKNGTVSMFTLLNRSCAAEQALFTGDNIVHLVNEIIIYTAGEPGQSDPRLDRLDLDTNERKYIQEVQSWLKHNWMPMCSLQGNGQFRFHQLQLPISPEKQYTITDESWYDPVTGRFARVMKEGKQIIFANSFDGQGVYFLERQGSGPSQLTSDPIAEGFRPPQNPAEFLGISSGIPASQQEDNSTPVQEIIEETLADGTPVTVYKVGFKDLFGDLDTYWLFKISQDDDIIAEMEFVLEGTTQMVIRRVVREVVEAPGYSWDLENLEPDQGEDQPGPQAVINPDMVIPDVSVQHMIERADYQTYMFAEDPAWTQQRTIVDCLDLPSPPHRMFMTHYQDDEGRDVVSVQSQTYNNTFGLMAHQLPIHYISPDGFKVWTGGPEKWWTNMVLRSAQLTPVADRRGFMVGTPAETYIAVAINGPISEEELRSLADSLIPAEEYLEEESKP